jgi:hypothetical protein
METVMSTRRACLGILLVATATVGCATSNDDPARRWMAAMDARPPEEQVPNWPEIRALMMREPPKVGESAPDFELALSDGGGTVRLSEFEPTRPVVLIFGSWT